MVPINEAPVVPPMRPLQQPSAPVPPPLVAPPPLAVPPSSPGTDPNPLVNKPPSSDPANR